jgi:DNA-binding Lrp family transcriptional regulator
MDDTDQQLISLLRQNARLSIADLAHKMGVSRGTVNNRLRKLEDQQIILGYTSVPGWGCRWRATRPGR